jgi:hypothetical protein
MAQCLISYAQRATLIMWGINEFSVSRSSKNNRMLMSCRQNAGQNQDINTANRCFENVRGFRYLETRVTNVEITSRLNSEYFVFPSATET